MEYQRISFYINTDPQQADDTRQWSLIPQTGYIFTSEFIAGLCYGLTHVLDELDVFHYKIVLIYNDPDDPDEQDMITLESKSDVVNTFDEFTDDTTYRDIRKDLRYVDNGSYIIALDGGRFINLAIVETPEFLQGLFTALTATNTSYDKVLLYKPYKNRTYYDIVGLELPIPV